MSKPVRILHVLGGLDTGGAESFVMNLYRAIDRNIIQFDFVKHIEDIGAYEEEITELGGKIYRCPKYTGKNHFYYMKWWNSFFKEHLEYHVVHGHVRSTAAIYLKIAKKFGIVTISHSHSTSNGKNISAVIKNIMQLPIRRIADYFFACSNEAGAWLYGTAILKKNNYHVIKNGIDLERFFYDKEKRILMRQKLGIEENTFVIGHVGRITTPKNHKFLIELFSKYYKENLNSKLLLVGDGDLFELIKQECSKLKIQDAVIMTGSKINTEDYYQIMDVFLFPSLWEGLGIAVIEAQANGLRCFVSENVPEEAILTDLVRVLPLETMATWLNELKNVQLGERLENMSEDLQQYDIHCIANRICDFYCKQHRKVKR